MSRSEKPRKTTMKSDLSCYLIGIELFNFKSYKGHHLVGPLTELTTIIGPNGSGKSNLMDAISFALVIKSDKLRAKNLSKLVNISSIEEEKEDSNMAYVKLVFKFKEVDSRTTTIMRSIVNNNNTTRFFIDNSQSSKVDYMNYLKKLGFNSKNKIFLIFQGTIDSLITKNPKDFTAILEEISGSSDFKVQYEDLKNKCLEKERQLHILFTKKQNYFKSKQFVDFLNKESEKNELLLKDIEEIKIKIILIELIYNKNQINQTKENLNNNLKVIDQTKLQITDLQEKKIPLEENISKFEQEKLKYKRLCREAEINIICKSKLKLQIAKDRVVQIENRLKNAKKNEKKLKSQINLSEKTIDQLKLEIENVKKEIVQIQTKIDQTSAEIQVSDEDIKEYNSLKELYEVRISSFHDEYSNVEKCLTDLKLKFKLNELKRDELENNLANLNFEYQPTLDKIDIDISDIENELKCIQSEENTLKSELKEAKQLSEKIKGDLQSCTENVKKKFFSAKRAEKVRKEKEFINYLCQNYEGIYGRLSDLCKPIHKKYQIAISRVMLKYLNAIVVDSFKTIYSCFKNEMSEFVNSEIFLALDKIKAPDIKAHLRNIQTFPNVVLVYDLIRCENSNIEKAVRFVVGNTLLCQNREIAAKVAYSLGDGNKYNVVALDGTYFQANGQISANLSQKVTHNSWDYSDYINEQSKKDSLQRELFSSNKNVELILQKIDLLNIKLTSLNAKRKMLIEKKESITKQKIQYDQDREMWNEQINELHKTLYELDLKISNNVKLFNSFQTKHNEIENEIFSNFLQKNNFTTIKQFETVYFNIMEDDLKYLNQCETRLKELDAKLYNEMERRQNESFEKWNKLIEEESIQLEQAKHEMESFQNQYDIDENLYKDMQNSLETCSNNLTKHEIELKNIEMDLTKTLKMYETANKTIVKLKSNLNKLYQTRHDLFKKSFIEAISLPFVDNYDVYKEIFTNLSQLNDTEIYQEEDNIRLDFKKLSINESDLDLQKYLQIKNDFESELERKEEEIKKLTLSDTSLSSRKTQLLKNIRLVNNEIDEMRADLSELKNQFETIKKIRCEIFTTFLEKASSNLNIFYKELMHSEASQSFLIAENPEEPYLGGVMYNCIVPGKMFQPISCLSGGEKTFAAFAFIFASYFDRLPCFFIMDEIDGPLDNTNISKLMHFLKTKIEHTQFILISLKTELFAQADSLVGVCREKIGNTFKSKTLTLDLRKYANN